MQKKRDAHNNPVTPERERFQAALAKRAMDIGLPGFKVAAYKPGDRKTEALLRERPSVPTPVADWDRHRFNSQVLERGIARVLNDTNLDLDLRTRSRVAQASWTNNVERMALDDCIDVIMLSLHEKRGRGQ